SAIVPFLRHPDLIRLPLPSKIDALWLISAMSLYLNHWQAETRNGVNDMRTKNELLQKLTPEIRHYMAKVFYEVEASQVDVFRTMPKHAHQKLCHLQSNLFGLLSLFGFSSDYLKLKEFLVNVSSKRFLTNIHTAKNRAQLKHEDSSNNYQDSFEGIVNGILSQNLRMIPLRAGTQAYVNFDTGCELDFPLGMTPNCCLASVRSEERRVGKECRSVWSVQ